MKQVYITHYNIWSEVISECADFLLAKDADGVNVYVVKYGMQQVRMKR